MRVRRQRGDPADHFRAWLDALALGGGYDAGIFKAADPVEIDAVKTDARDRVDEAIGASDNLLPGGLPIGDGIVALPAIGIARQDPVRRADAPTFAPIAAIVFGLTDVQIS